MLNKIGKNLWLLSGVMLIISQLSLMAATDKNSASIFLTVSNKTDNEIRVVPETSNAKPWTNWIKSSFRDVSGKLNIPQGNNILVEFKDQPDEKIIIPIDGNQGVYNTDKFKVEVAVKKEAFPDIPNVKAYSYKITASPQPSEKGTKDEGTKDETTKPTEVTTTLINNTPYSATLITKAFTGHFPINTEYKPENYEVTVPKLNKNVVKSKWVPYGNASLNVTLTDGSNVSLNISFTGEDIKTYDFSEAKATVKIEAKQIDLGYSYVPNIALNKFYNYTITIDPKKDEETKKEDETKPVLKQSTTMTITNNTDWDLNFVSEAQGILSNYGNPTSNYTLKVSPKSTNKKESSDFAPGGQASIKLAIPGAAPVSLDFDLDGKSHPGLDFSQATIDIQATAVTIEEKAQGPKTYYNYTITVTPKNIVVDPNAPKVVSAITTTIINNTDYRVELQTDARDLTSGWGRTIGRYAIPESATGSLLGKGSHTDKSSRWAPKGKASIRLQGAGILEIEFDGQNHTYNDFSQATVKITAIPVKIDCAGLTYGTATCNAFNYTIEITKKP